MARFVKAIKEDNLFSNQQAVKNSIDHHNKTADSLFQQIRNLINEYQEKGSDLFLSNQIPNHDKLIPTINASGKTWVQCNNGVITVSKGYFVFMPLLAKQPLGYWESFTVEVVDSALKRFMVGVAT